MFDDKIRLEHSVTGDVVVNLAAIHRDDVTDKDAYYRTNVLGALMSLRYVKRKKLRLYFGSIPCSSLWVCAT